MATARWTRATSTGDIDTINGLPILGEAGLQAWYENNIMGGTGGFVVPAADFDAFGAAIQQKLIAEISREVPTPEPATMALLGTGLLGLGILRRRATRKSA